MRVLLDKKHIDTFNNLLHQFLSLISTQNPNFATYFTKEYVQRKEEWAYAGSEINTNMFAESFHKVVYLRNKQNRRVNHLLSVLLCISKDKAFERVCKLEKGTYPIALVKLIGDTEMP